MSGDERDLSPTVHRAIDELRRLPATDADAVRRVVSAAAAARVAPADDEPILTRPRRRVRTWIAATLAVAAGVLGFIARGALVGRDSSHSTSDLHGAATALPTAPSQVSLTNREALPVPHLFVFNDPTAHRVAVVGDFNQWNAARDPMSRAPDGDLWSATIAIIPGRHTYGFMVDDSVLVLDPRAPRTRDPDLGAEGSVVIVGRP